MNALLLVTLLAVAELPSSGDQQVCRLLEPIAEQHGVPALWGGVLIGDELVASGAVGVRKWGSEQPAEVGDQLHLGSCTKAMTATLLGMLVDEGLLQWDSTIGDVFRTQRGRIHRDCHDITLQQLLRHRSGLPANTHWGILQQQFATARGAARRPRLISVLLKEAPESEPDSTFNYSNLGYMVAGAMAEQVTGKSWEELMTQRLFQPLEMTSAGFGPPGTKDQVDQPWGHLSVETEARTDRGAAGEQQKRRDPQPLQGDNPAVLGPAGTVHASLTDWARFISLHLAAGEGSSNLLKAETLEQLHTPPAGEQYAGGWLVADRPWADGVVLTHAGSNTLWYCVVWVAPKKNLAVLAVTNIAGQSAERACDDASGELIRYHSRLGREE